MSNSLAIATVSAALAAVITKSIQEVVGGAEVIIGRPQVTPPANAQHWVQLCLYQVVPNAALRNADLPTRNSAGKLTQKPQVALDLHYLLAFYGDDKDLEPQRMLGAVARDLHANPLLTPQILSDAIASWPVLGGSNIDQSPERVRLTPLPLSLEELSKLWSVFFQTPYALSMAYHASVVLIETDDAVSPAPPVLQRGENDRGVDAFLGAFPRLEKIHIGFAEDAPALENPSALPSLPSLPNAWLGLTLDFQGQYLAGDQVTLRFSHPRLGNKDVIITPDNRRADSLRFTLPADSAAQTEWAAGAYTVTALIKQGDSIRTTNPLSLNLAARIIAITPANPIGIIADNVNLTLEISPKILVEQNTSLLIANRQIIADPLANPSALVSFTLNQAVPVPLQPVYIRIDGVDSLPIERVANPARFVFADNQKVEIQ